ncbi:MAG: helix-turn-helix transcriptional regulator [Chloroflexota bacterium]
MTEERYNDKEPCYVISIAARLVQLHPQTLRYYDRIGLLRPSRSSGRIRLYSQCDVDTLRKIVRLTDELGVNLAGVEVIINMSGRMEEMQRELERVQREAQAGIELLRERLREVERRFRDAEGSHPVISVSAREGQEPEEGQA